MCVQTEVYQDHCKVSLKSKIHNDVIWADTMLQPSEFVSHKRLRRLGHLAKKPNDRAPKRVLFGHMDGTAIELKGRAQNQWG